MVKVLDASAMIAFIEEKAGCEKVRQLFSEASANKCTLLMSSVNWGEVRYVLLQRYNRAGLEIFDQISPLLPVRIVSVDREVIAIAADLKFEYGLGYCDAIAAALAKLYKAECVTRDKDFNVLKEEIAVDQID